MQRKVKVLDKPFTYILTDSPLTDEEIRLRWLEKNKYRRPLSDFQVDKERAVVRGGKLLQIKKYKR
jgi:hypothetical protein